MHHLITITDNLIENFSSFSNYYKARQMMKKMAKIYFPYLIAKEIKQGLNDEIINDENTTILIVTNFDTV